jgi:hypothetical protein
MMLKGAINGESCLRILGFSSKQKTGLPLGSPLPLRNEERTLGTTLQGKRESLASP